MIRQRAVGDGFHEEITILNHDMKPVDLTVRIDAGSDFADLFEVKDALAKKGRYSTRVEGGRLVLGYERETFRRATVISATAPADVDEGGFTFSVQIEPHGEWTTAVDVVTAGAARGRGQRGAPAEALAEGHAEGLDRWLAHAPRLESDWTPSGRPTSAASSILRPCGSRRRSPAARACRRPGCRGSWRCSAETASSRACRRLPFTSELALATLRALGEWQGTRMDDFRDEDPGRIMHEMRYGEMTAFEERPHSPVLRRGRHDPPVRDPAGRVRALDR